MRLFLACFIACLCVLSGSHGVAANAPSLSANTIRAYAEIYPELFKTPEMAPANGYTNPKAKALKLLVSSFQDTTDFDALEALLKSKQPVVTPLKSDDQIKALLASKGLNWSQYQQINKLMVTNPTMFSSFFLALNTQALQQQVVSQAQANPAFIETLGSSPHRIILTKLMKQFEKLPTEAAYQTGLPQNQ